MTQRSYLLRADLPEGKAIDIVPMEDVDDAPEHELSGFCWCQPLAEYQVTGGIVYIHRRSLDSPHIEVGP